MTSGAGQEGKTDAGARSQLVGKLKRTPKKTIALLALLPVLVVVWIPVIKGKGKPTAIAARPPAAPAAPPGAAVHAAPIPGGSPSRVLPEAEDLGRRVARLCDPAGPRWNPDAGSDPFSSSADPVSAGPARGPRLEDLVPTSIFLSPGQPAVAIIQGRTFRQGDELDGLVILAIEERQVRFQGPDQIYTVSLPEPSVRRGR